MKAFLRLVHMIQVFEPSITQIQEISDPNQHFYELKQ